MHKNVTTLMGKEVSRSEFLSVVGLAVASIFGLSTIIRLLTGESLEHRAGNTLGYGSSAYGGSRPRR